VVPARGQHVRPGRGGVVAADEVVTCRAPAQSVIAIASGDSIEFAGLTALAAGEPADRNEPTRASADCLAALRTAEGSETALLPLGEGVVGRQRGG
jgi:hypothetical protein